MTEDNSTIEENLRSITAAIDAAVKEGDARKGGCTLVAVSKTKPASLISQAIGAGQRVFGENRVQEAGEKWPALKSACPDIELHLIGPLQSNKVRQALELFDVIETLDRPKLARSIARISEELGVRPRLYIQVNTGEEEQKSGIAPSDLPDFVHLCRDELGLNVVGLMCIPPVGDVAALHFALLGKLAKENELDHLSMGMSGDYEVAAKLGATSVRVGTAVFGAR